MLQPFEPREGGKTLVIYAGGTIGMKKSAAGLIPDADFIPRLREACGGGNFAAYTCDPVIDSSSATPQDWENLAAIVRENRERYANFVILHGTDTLSYTAAALSEMLQGLGKAVVITGAQIPLGEPDSDALNNFRGALAFARLPELQQTAVFFHDRLLRADAVQKVDAQSFAAFDSPKADWLGVFSVGEPLLTMPAFSTEAESAFLQGHWQGFPQQAVAVILLVPNLSPAAFLPILTDPTIQAVVFLSFGVGNFPVREDLQTAIHIARQRGVLLVNVSQCQRSEIAGHVYAGGGARLGLLSGGALTPEMAFTRLYVLLAENDPEPLTTRWLKRLKS